MINLQDQEELIKLVSRKLKRDVSCFVFGGTAMMYFGYKNATKDIDILFDQENELKEFTRIIKELGYKEISASQVYTKEKLELEKPKIFTRGEERFDIFFKTIFKFTPSKEFKERFYARYDYKENEFTFTIYVVSKEDIILLKSLTERENDFSDILTIIEKEKEINWDIITNEAINQKYEWTKIDLEETMQKLKKYVFIKQKYFDKLY